MEGSIYISAQVRSLSCAGGGRHEDSLNSLTTPLNRQQEGLHVARPALNANGIVNPLVGHRDRARMRNTTPIPRVDVLTIAITITVSVMPLPPSPSLPYCSSRAMITDWFHGVKISKSYDYQGFLATHFSPARVNCNREYARATDPCGSRPDT